MLKSGEPVFLDDMTVEDVEKTLQIKVSIVESSGTDFVNCILE
jgi:NifB/MoaA-like Fe-S oxidoreductase